MTTCNGNHATIDDLLDCPTCEAFLGEDSPLYTCGICGWCTSNDVGEISYHRATWHTDY